MKFALSPTLAFAQLVIPLADARALGYFERSVSPGSLRKRQLNDTTTYQTTQSSTAYKTSGTTTGALSSYTSSLQTTTPSIYSTVATSPLMTSAQTTTSLTTSDSSQSSSTSTAQISSSTVVASFEVCCEGELGPAPVGYDDVNVCFGYQCVPYGVTSNDHEPDECAANNTDAVCHSLQCTDTVGCPQFAACSMEKAQAYNLTGLYHLSDDKMALGFEDEAFQCSGDCDAQCVRLEVNDGRRGLPPTALSISNCVSVCISLVNQHSKTTLCGTEHDQFAKCQELQCRTVLQQMYKGSFPTMDLCSSAVQQSSTTSSNGNGNPYKNPSSATSALGYGYTTPNNGYNGYTTSANANNPPNSNGNGVTTPANGNTSPSAQQVAPVSTRIITTLEPVGTGMFGTATVLSVPVVYVSDGNTFTTTSAVFASTPADGDGVATTDDSQQQATPSAAVLTTLPAVGTAMFGTATVITVPVVFVSDGITYTTTSTVFASTDAAPLFTPTLSIESYSSSTQPVRLPVSTTSAGFRSISSNFWLLFGVFLGVAIFA